MLNAEETSSTLEISEKCLISSASQDKLGTNFHFQEKGVDLISKGKVAIALIVNDTENLQLGSYPDLENSANTEKSMFSFLQTLLCDDQRFAKVILILYFSCKVLFPDHFKHTHTKVYIYNFFFPLVSL